MGYFSVGIYLEVFGDELEGFFCKALFPFFTPYKIASACSLTNSSHRSSSHYLSLSNLSFLDLRY